MIYDSTDETMPTGDSIPVLAPGGEYMTYIPSETSLAINVYDTFGMPDLRPRGFPLQNLHDQAPTMFTYSPAKPLIQQGNP